MDSAGVPGLAAAGVAGTEDGLDGEGTPGVGTIARVEASKRRSTWPSRNNWPGLRMALVTRSPWMKVPLVELKSPTTTSSPRNRISQCRPEMDVSLI